MPETEPSPSPSLGASDSSPESQTPNGAETSPAPAAKPSAKRGRRGVWLWLIAALIALGAAGYFALDEQQWRRAQETAQAWSQEATAFFAILRGETPDAQPPQPPQQQPTAQPAPPPAQTTAAQDPAATARSANEAAMQRWVANTELKVRQLQADSQQTRQILETVAQRQNDMQQRLGAQAPQTPQTRQAAVALGLLQLSLASASGAPFEAERRILAALLPDNNHLAALQTIAPQGVPSESALLLQALSLAERLAVTREDTPSATPAGAYVDWLFGLVQIRRLDESPLPQDMGDAEVSQGDTLLADMTRTARNGNLRGAVAAAMQLRDAEAEAAADWLLAAQQRLELQARIASLSTALTPAAPTQTQQ